MIEILLEAARLKQVRRAGWVRCGVPDAESVAGHCWGISWLILLFLPSDLNREKALTYAALHDLAEVRVGDITPHDGVAPARKKALEDAALRELLAEAPAGVRDAALNYQRGDDPEAQFVKQLDRLDMAIQATVYAEQTGKNLREFMDSARRELKSPVLIDVWERLIKRHTDT